MILKQHEILKWHGRKVLKGTGKIRELRREIPYFTTTEFRIDDGGVNEYLTLIVREPVEENQGYIFPSDDQTELKIPVATVSKEYELVQHHDVVEALEAALLEANRLRIRSISLKLLDDVTKLLDDVTLTITKYGEQMRISFTLRDYKFDPGDGGEVILLRVNALNSVNKTTPLEVNLTWCSVNFMTDMLAPREERLKKIHRKSRTPLKSTITEFLQQQLCRASEDIREFKEWQRTKVVRVLSKVRPSAVQIEHWINETVAKRWGIHAAARVYHIAKTG